MLVFHVLMSSNPGLRLLTEGAMRVSNHAAVDDGDDMIVVINGIGNFVDGNLIVIGNKLVVSSVVCEGREDGNNGVREIY